MPLGCNNEILINMHQKEMLHDDSQAKNVKISNWHLIDVALTAHEYSKFVIMVNAIT